MIVEKSFKIMIVKTILSMIFIFLILAGCEKKPVVIPKPLQMKSGSGEFDLKSSTPVYVEKGSEKSHMAASYLVHTIRNATGIELTFEECDDIDTISRGIIFSSSNTDQSLGNEGYNLDIDVSSIFIKGEPAGQFYAVQTLLQLAPVQVFNEKRDREIKNLQISSLSVIDKPRFKWRGMHLDVGRHMFPVSFIKKYINYLAMHKMNVFHWHLTEDQGWRIEIKRYPALMETGAYRAQTLIGYLGKEPHVFDGKRYGGYYTQDEIKKIVKYAEERFITIVPEIEMPGHSLAALASYPHLSCTGDSLKVGEKWGISEDIYCAGNDGVFTFLENVLSEVVDLFPSEYIHIGGDEAPKARWEKCDKCQMRIKDEGLKDEHELQSYFISRMEKFLNDRGRQIIGWDEILEGGLAPNASVMSWRGIEGGIAAAEAGHNVVMSPYSHCYFDYYQDDPESEPLAIGGDLPIETVYAYEPIPENLTEEQARYILGAQGNVWTEYISDPMKVEYMALPRMSALAEVVWTAKDQRDFNDFKDRLEEHKKRLDLMGVNYFPKNRELLIQ